MSSLSRTRTSEAGENYESVIETIERIRNGSNRPSDYPLPGHGESYGEEDDQPTCGKKEEPRFCPNCGDWHVAGNACGRWSCNRCWKRACLKRSVSVASKIVEHRQLVGAERNQDNESSPDRPEKPHLHRIIISPPEDFSTSAEKPINRLIEAGKDILTHGSKGDESGGAIIPHLYRSAGDSDDDDRGFWKEILPDGANGFTPNWSETRDKLSLEPHLHCYIVADKFWLDTDTIQNETDWTIRRIEPNDDNSHSVDNQGVLVRSVQYALSHSAVRDGDMYRYFGRTANISAGEQTEAWIDKLARQRAPKILGLPSQSLSCDNEVEDGEEESWYDFGDSDGDSKNDSSAGAGDDEYTTCGGRLLHIRELDRFLGDNDWSESKEEELRELKRWYFNQSGPPPDFVTD